MRGRGIYLYEMRFGEMMGDDDDVMKCVGVKFHVMNGDISL